MACDLAAPLYSGHTELTGAPLLLHALGAATILIILNMDAETIAAHDTAWQCRSIWTTGGRRWKPVSAPIDCRRLVRKAVHAWSKFQRSLARSAAARPRSAKNGDHAQRLESLPQNAALCAMVQNPRVLIKLASAPKPCAIVVGGQPRPAESRFAQESQGIFAPLANRLGRVQIKWELEDLSLRYLEPQLYKDVAKMLDERRVDRDEYIIDVADPA